MNAKRKQLRIRIHWRPVVGEPSQLWRRLWSKLLADKKIGNNDVYEEHNTEELDDGNEQNLPKVWSNNPEDMANHTYTE